jgi:hypothetical protein
MALLCNKDGLYIIILFNPGSSLEYRSFCKWLCLCRCFHRKEFLLKPSICTIGYSGKKDVSHRKPGEIRITLCTGHISDRPCLCS